MSLLQDTKFHKVKNYKIKEKSEIIIEKDLVSVPGWNQRCSIIWSFDNWYSYGVLLSNREVESVLSNMKPWAFGKAPRPGTSHLFAQINNLRLNKLGPVLSEVSSSRHIKRLKSDNVF